MIKITAIMAMGLLFSGPVFSHPESACGGHMGGKVFGQCSKYPKMIEKQTKKWESQRKEVARLKDRATAVDQAVAQPLLRPLCADSCGKREECINKCVKSPHAGYNIPKGALRGAFKKVEQSPVRKRAFEKAEQANKLAASYKQSLDKRKWAYQSCQLGERDKQAARVSDASSSMAPVRAKAPISGGGLLGLSGGSPSRSTGSP